MSKRPIGAVVSDDESDDDAAVDDVSDDESGDDAAARRPPQPAPAAAPAAAAAVAILYPRATASALLERRAVHQVGLLCSQNNVIFRETSNTDVGIDGEFEFIKPDGVATGVRCPVQIKMCTDAAHPDRATARATTSTVHYWSRFRGPVILIGVNGSNIFYVNVNHAHAKIVTAKEQEFRLTTSLDSAALTTIKRAIVREAPKFLRSDVLRCPRCNWEVNEGQCEGGCGFRYSVLFPLASADGRFLCPFGRHDVVEGEQCEQCSRKECVIDWTEVIPTGNY